MISERKALVRQIQQMFHEHLVGVYRWDDASIAKPIEVKRIPGQDREAGKYPDHILMRLGSFDLKVSGPADDPQWPCGRVQVKRGKHSLDGPLDARTWLNVANFIKEHKQEENNDGEGSDEWIAARDSWGR